MNIEVALELIEQMLRDNLTGSGDLEELQRVIASNDAMLAEICKRTGYSPKTVHSMISSGLSRVRKSEAEFRCERTPRRFRN